MTIGDLFGFWQFIMFIIILFFISYEGKLIFAWYDFWIGIFYDKSKRWVYIFPVPMFGIILKIPFPKDYCKFCKKAPCQRLGIYDYDIEDED